MKACKNRGFYFALFLNKKGQIFMDSMFKLLFLLYAVTVKFNTLRVRFKENFCATNVMLHSIFYFKFYRNVCISCNVLINVLIYTHNNATSHLRNGLL